MGTVLCKLFSYFYTISLSHISLSHIHSSRVVNTVFPFVSLRLIHLNTARAQSF